jgi:hypothetical protein
MWLQARATGRVRPRRKPLRRVFCSGDRAAVGRPGRVDSARGCAQRMLVSGRRERDEWRASTAVEARVRKAGANTCQEREKHTMRRMFSIQRPRVRRIEIWSRGGKLESWRWWTAGCDGGCWPKIEGDDVSAGNLVVAHHSSRYVSRQMPAHLGSVQDGVVSHRWKGSRSKHTDGRGLLF